MSESIPTDNGLTISVTIKGARQPAVTVLQPVATEPLLQEPTVDEVPEPFDYDAHVTRLLSDPQFLDALWKRLGLDTMSGQLQALKVRVEQVPTPDGEDRGEEPQRPRIMGYVVQSEGSVRLFSAADIYGTVWGMETRNYSPLLRADVDPEEALYLRDEELMNGNYRMFGPKALDDLKAKRRPLNYRGIHIPSDNQYAVAVGHLETFRDADETGMFAYHLAGNQTVICINRSFRAVVQIMLQNGITCREFAVDPGYPHNVSGES